MQKSSIGLIGLGVMGQNLARNIANKKIKISVFNRTAETTEEFIKKFGSPFIFGHKKLTDFINSLEKPRKIILLIKAGTAVDEIINQLTPLLDKNDIIIECGNSFYRDTQRRFKELSQNDINFIGCGISGGEEGALHGPSLMPGGNHKAYKNIEPILKKIAAKDFSKKPCVSFIGNDAAGHYIKMVHNGIEYGVMQIISEAYDILRKTYKISAPQIAEIFKNYKKLKSFLMEITVKVLQEKDKKDFLIDKILDKAGQKGTGTWTAEDSFQRAVAIPSITEAVYARIISGEKELRKNLSKKYKSDTKTVKIPLKTLEEALYAAILLTYIQGFELIKKAAEEENWKINLSEISRIWQGGCIIRADLLKLFHKIYKTSPKINHLLESKEIVKELKSSIPKLRELVLIATQNAVPLPSISASLNHFDNLTSEKSPANLIQGLRDFFGAHTFERTDKKGTFHHNWPN